MRQGWEILDALNTYLKDNNFKTDEDIGFGSCITIQLWNNINEQRDVLIELYCRDPVGEVSVKTIYKIFIEDQSIAIIEMIDVWGNTVNTEKYDLFERDSFNKIRSYISDSINKNHQLIMSEYNNKLE